MEIEIDTAGATPVYEQLVQQITFGVLTGSLSSGDSLPAIRQLAKDLELNPNTVAKAYKLLEGSRIIQTAGRKGTFICKDAAKAAATDNLQTASYQLEVLLTSFCEKGMSYKEIAALLKNKISQLRT